MSLHLNLLSSLSTITSQKKAANIYWDIIILQETPAKKESLSSRNISNRNLSTPGLFQLLSLSSCLKKNIKLRVVKIRLKKRKRELTVSTHLVQKYCDVRVWKEDQRQKSE